MPFIWIPAGKVSIQMKEGSNKEKRYYCNDCFSVVSITYNNDREISGLAINNDKGQMVYELKSKADTVGRKEKTVPKGKKENSQQKQEAQKGYSTTEGISKEQMDSLQAELDRTGVTMETMQGRYQIQEPGAMDAELYSRVMSALKRTKSTEAA